MAEEAITRQRSIFRTLVNIGFYGAIILGIQQGVKYGQLKLKEASDWSYYQRLAQDMREDFTLEETKTGGLDVKNGAKAYPLELRRGIVYYKLRIERCEGKLQAVAQALTDTMEDHQ